MGKKNKQKQNQDSDNKQNQPQENPRQQPPEQKQKKQSGDAGNANQDGQRGQQPSGGGNKEQGKQQWRDGGQQRPPQGQSQQSGGNTRGGNEGRSGLSQQHQQPRQEGARGNQPKQQQQQSGGGQQDGQQRSAGGHQGQQKQQPGNQGAGKSSQQQQPARQEGAWGGQPKQQQQQPGAGRQDGQQRGGGQQDGQQRSWGGHQGQQKQQPGSQGQPKQQQPGGGQQDGQQRGGGQQDGQQRSWGGHQGQQKQQPGSQGAGRSSQQQQPARQEGAWGGQPKQQQQQPSRGWQDGQQRGGGQQDGQQRSWGGHQGQQKQQPGSQGAGRSSQQQQPARQEGSQANQQQSDGGQQGARAGQNRQQFGGQQQQPPKQGGGWGQRQEAGGGQRRQAGGGDGGGPQQQKQQQPYGQEGPRRGQSGQQQFAGAQQRPRQQQGSGFPAGGESVPPYKDVSCAGVQRGSLGKQGVCEVNYLRMNIDKMSDTAYHYDVTITPDRPKKFLRPVFDQCQRQYFKDYVMAYDGSKSCYSIKRLPKKSFDYEVEVPDSGGRTKSFTIQIKETDIPEIDLASLRSYHNDRVFDKPMRALQALEVVLASNNHALGIRVGRSFYRKPAEFYDLGDGYEMYTGIYQAAILGEVPLLNVDISHKSFPKTQPIIQYLKECGIDTNRTIEDYRMKKTILQFLKGIDIVYAPPASFGAIPKKKKVIDIGDAPAKTFFTLDDGTKMNVKDYFASKGCILQYPYLNCITTGSTTRKIALPIEFCSVAEDQVLNRKDGNMQVSKMIKYSATSTNERKNKIMNLMAHFRHNENSTIRSFGIQLGGNFIKVHFRLLPPPELEYCGGKTACPRDGAWQLADVKFLETSKVNQGHKWAIVYENKGRPINAHSLEDFKKAVQRTAQQVDVKLAQEGEIRGFQNIDWVLQDLAKEGYALVIVVLPNYGTSYSSVKQNAELKVGILTQCIKERTVLRAPKDASVIHNLMLKVNAKLNGTNHKVSEEKEAGLKELLQPISNVMFMGADVTHPSPDQRHIPSVVGVAASHDAYGACYNMQYRLQRSTVEEIEDMKSITEYHLNVYKSYQNRYPAHIIYYRDGVSDGQFPKIKKDELGGIRRACDQAGCNPKITCLIVVKRHHTRFFPLRQSQGYRDFNNVEPGTVVDQYIVHPNEKQFFLVSHKAVQGTAKPTRYNVIEDDANFNIDLLQKLSYNLCHMFPRCNRAVSYPAPAYLAHLVAFRGRVYLEGTMRFGNLKDEYKKRSIQSVLMKRNPMYFV